MTKMKKSVSETPSMTEYLDGTKRWHLKSGKLHREDGPAIEAANGNKEWYLNGKRHRKDGPAIEYAAGGKVWYLYGLRMSEYDFNLRMKEFIKFKEINVPNCFDELKSNPVEDKSMSNNNVMSRLKTSASKAPYRVARMQAVTVGKQKILELLKGRLTEQGFSFASQFLDSDVGQGVIMALIGLAGPNVPKIGSDPRVQALCEEFLDEGVAKGANEAFSLISSILMPSLMAAVDSLPSLEQTKELAVEKVKLKKKTRVATKPRVKEEDESDSSDESVAEVVGLRSVK